MTYREVKSLLVKELNSIYNASEAEAIFFCLLEHNNHMSRMDYLMNTGIEVKEQEIWKQQISRLTKHEPVQHIVGTAPFCGLQISVNRSVLIPRPETEELVNMILCEHNHVVPLHILDVGTGSGCIALALKNGFTNGTITGIDISKEAIETARKNAELNKLDVVFKQQPIEKYKPENPLDIIVSNPPYIPAEDACLLEKHVLEYEPELALFAPENDPLYFYKIIGDFAIEHLKKPGGRLYFEAHHIFSKPVKEHFEKLAETQLINDMFGKPRFVKISF